jgi:hypothetical protein
MQATAGHIEDPVKWLDAVKQAMTGLAESKQASAPR